MPGRLFNRLIGIWVWIGDKLRDHFRNKFFTRAQILTGSITPSMIRDRFWDSHKMSIKSPPRGVFHLRHTECRECKNAIRFGRADSRSSGFLFERHRVATQ